MASLPPSTSASSGATTHIQVVHTPGITRTLYAPRSAGVQRLFTAGDDYLVRLLPAAYNSTEEALLIDDSTAPVTWIDAGQSHLVVASEDGSVRLYKHRGGDANAYGDEVDSPTQLYGVLARTSLPTRCVALERALPPGKSKSPRAAICSDELIVKLVDVEDTKRVNLLTGHSRAVRAASWSPQDATLVTSSCDGTARVWDCTTAEPGCTKVIENLPASRPEDATDLHAEWHPSGEFFVLPSKTNDLVIYSASRASGYVKTGVFAAPARGSSAINAPTGAVTATAFCPNGRYLAAATTDGQVTIWETSSRAPIRAQRAEADVTGLSWQPDDDNLAWVDTSGQLVRWIGVVGAQYPSPHEAVAFPSTTSSRNHHAAAVDDLFADTGIDDDDGDVVLPDEDDDVHGAGADDDAAMDDFVVDDDGNGRQYSKPRAVARRGFGRMPAPAPRAQPPFQPNSTPMRNSRRFLSLSLFGSLISIDQDTHHVVSFESFDSAARRNWKMVDHYGYSMASVGATGALLACPQKDDSPSALHFKPFEAAGSWSAPGAEWGVELPLGEQVVALAMGGAPPSRRNAAAEDDSIARTAAALTSTAIVATSSGYLRFFSSSGLQRYVWAFGSQVVAIAAGKQHAIVVHRGHDAAQSLSYSIIDLISFEMRQTGSLPLGKDVQLRWVGFNELDVAAVYDSRGVMYLLDRAFAHAGQARWVPVLDSADGAGDDTSRVQFWPLSLSSTQLFCVFVRGALQFPDPCASGHPLIQEVDLKLPILPAGGPGAALEEKHLRQTLLASSIRSAFASLVVPPTEYASDVPDPSTLVHDADKELLQLIQMACKEDKHARAWDAARELSSGRMLDAALQIASFFHLPSLADRMDTLREWVESRAERDERLEAGEVSGVGVDEFSMHSERARRGGRGARGGVFAGDSVSPAPAPAAVTAAHARRALMEGFDSSASGTPRRSAAAAGAQPSSSMLSMATATPASASASTSVPLREGMVNRKRSRDGDGDDGEGSDGGRGDDSDGYSDTERMPAPKVPVGVAKTQNAAATAAAAPAAAPAPPRGNPFARPRQPGSMTRDRSMHKSNSFFDRAEADLTGGGRGQPQQQQQSKKTKQSTLFGMKPKAAAAAGAAAAKEATAAAARPAFAETQDADDDDDTGMATGTDESQVRATLQSVNEREDRREARGGLEETQYGGGVGGDDDEGESQSQSQSQSQQATVDNGDVDAAAAPPHTGRSKLEAFRRRGLGQGQGQGEDEESQAESVVAA